jgi:hypothetical protein
MDQHAKLNQGELTFNEIKELLDPKAQKAEAKTIKKHPYANVLPFSSLVTGAVS